MQILDKAELAMLAILGYPDIAKQAMAVYAKKKILFNPFLYPHLNRMITEYLKTVAAARKSGTKPTADTVAAGLSEALMADRTLTNEQRTKSELILQRLLDAALPLLEDGKAALTDCIIKQEMRSIGSMVAEQAAFSDIVQTVNASSKMVEEMQHQDEPSARQFIFTPLRSIRELTKFVPRMSTGISFLDEVSHGGLRVGECWLVLGPSGGGKSAMAVQLACAQAVAGNDVVWCTYEQSLYGDLAERIVAFLTDTSLDLIRDKGFDAIPEDVQHRFEDIAAGCMDKMSCLDMAQFSPDPGDPLDVGGMYSVCRRVKAMKDEGRDIKLVLVDWLGAMASRVFAKTGGEMKTHFAAFAQSQVMYAHDFAEKNNVCFLFFHQTDTKAQSASPTYCPDMTNARDDHGLCYYFDVVLALGRRDPHSICWLNPAKTRKAHTQPITLKLIGDKAKFISVTGWSPSRDGKFYNPDEPDEEEQFQDKKPASQSYKRELG